MVAIAVTSSGSIPGIAVINALRAQSEIPVRVVAMDMDALSAGFYLSDASYVIPGASDPLFIDAVLDVCRREKPSVLFPIIDEELIHFAECSRSFANLGVKVITNEALVVRLVQDKYATWQFCREHGVRAPQTWLTHELPDAASLKYPLIVKPRTGRGTVGVFKAANAAELSFFTKYVPDAIVQNCVEGQEFTIDVLTDFEGTVLSVVPKARLQVKAGMQVKGRTVLDLRLIDYALQMVRLFNLKPRCNIQCIISDGDIYLIEINPKFAASLPFTVAAGVNAPLLLLKMCMGQRVDPFVGEFKDGLTMLRYWQEIYVEKGSPVTHAAVCPTGRIV